MSKKVVMATNNANKLREVREILSPLGFEVFSQSEVNVSVEPDENGTTFKENSHIKARAVYDALAEKMAVIADDSGLCVDCLEGRPGVHSARYAPKGEECDKLLKELEGVEPEKRTAHFVCGITFLDEHGKAAYIEGKLDGEIALEKRGENGFGYDPVFLYNYRTLAEMTAEEKNEISHRGKALIVLSELLKGRYC